MDVTPKSKQPGSLKRRPLGLSRSARTKLLKTEGTSSDSAERAEALEGNDSPTSTMGAPIPEQQCTPVRPSSLQNELSPQYPHMFRIFHDDSPEFRVGWDDGISEMVTKKDNPFFDSSIHSRTIASQQMKRHLKRFPTPPRLKQQPVTADVMEYMQWAKSLVEKARNCTSQTPSPNETQTSNSAVEDKTKDSHCDKLKGALNTNTKETLSTTRRSLPVPSSSCSSKDSEVNRKSLPTESQYSNFFDDSANDDMFVKCSQAIEDNLLKDEQTIQKNVNLSLKTVNNNVITHGKASAVVSKAQLSNEVKSGQSSNLGQSLRREVTNSNFTTPKNTPTKNVFQPQTVKPATINSVNKAKHGASNFIQKVQLTGQTTVGHTVASSITLLKPSDGNRNSSLDSSFKDSGNVQLLDEDDDFLSSLDLQSLTEMNPSRSASVPNKNKNINKTVSSCPVSSAKINVISTKFDINCRENSVSASNCTAVSNINSVTFNVSASNRISNQVLPNAGEICTQEVIRRKREEAQRRLRSKMQRHLSL